LPVRCRPPPAAEETFPPAVRHERPLTCRERHPRCLGHAGLDDDEWRALPESALQIPEERAIHHHQGLHDRGIAVAVLDKFAVALAELPEEMSIRRGAADVTGPCDPAVAVVGEAFVGLRL